MRLFPSRKKTTINQRRSVNENLKGAKISNYYAPSTRSSGVPKIDTSKRGASSKKVSLSRAGHRNLKWLLATIFGIFVIYNLLYLRSEPIIVLDRETAVDRIGIYEPAISNMVRSSIFNNNKLTLRAADLEGAIVKEFPEVETAVVSASLVGKRPVVHLHQQDLPFSIESNGKRYVIGANGIVAGEASGFNGISNTVFIKDESGVAVKKGDRILRSDDAEFIISATKLLKLQGREVENIVLTAVPREAYITLSDTPYKLRVYLDESVDTQIGTYFAAVKTLGERGEAPTAYIDLRAGEKVYWQ